MASHQHSHSHSHSHTHDHHPSESGRLVLSIALNLLITVAETVGGILSGSLALLSDAVHNLSDTASLGISYTARRISRKEATAAKTFGYRRAEIIGAFINLIALVFIALFLVKEAVERFFNPQPIDGQLMLVIAAVGLLANMATAILLYRGSRTSLNLRSAFLHIFSDGLSSVGVVIGGFLILRYQIYIIDPILTVAVSIYLLVHSYYMLRDTVDILMEGTPRGVDVAAILEDVRRVDRVIDVHHVHVWKLDEKRLALEAHVVISDDDLPEMETIKTAVKTRLSKRHDIAHATLELEHIPCGSPADPHCYDHAAESGNW